MATFVDLPGVAGGKLEGPMASSVHGFMNALRENRVCSGAGDNGSVTVWLDDEAVWHCSFTRFRMEIDTVTANTKAQVRAWLREWLPECR